MRSLSARLLVSVSLLLVVFFGLTIAALDLVFRNLSEQAIRDRLAVQALALISASDEIAGGGLVPGPQLAEARFANPGSGLYGEIRAADGSSLWRSPSSVGSGLEFESGVTPGVRHFDERRLNDGSSVLALSMGIVWEMSGGTERDFVFSVAESLEPYRAQLARFRGQLFGWFGSLMVLLLVALATLFRRLLEPLRRIESEIAAVESGERAELGSGYPRELAGVTQAVNTLVRSERERLARYRNTLGNLAHSLKTPLALMRATLEQPELQDRPQVRTLDEHIERMNAIVRYQLNRASASGSSGLGRPAADLTDVLAPVAQALEKVYAEKRVRCRLEIAAGMRFGGDTGDLIEIAGNLLDNAFKWCRSEVRVVARAAVGTAKRDALQLIVEDDGPGIAEQDRARVLERGTRLDERVAGQGIGLSVVREIVTANGGSLTIGRSSLGGARVEIVLPAGRV